MSQEKLRASKCGTILRIFERFVRPDAPRSRPQKNKDRRNPSEHANGSVWLVTRGASALLSSSCVRRSSWRLVVCCEGGGGGGCGAWSGDGVHVTKRICLWLHTRHSSCACVLVLHFVASLLLCFMCLPLFWVGAWLRPGYVFRRKLVGRKRAGVVRPFGRS